MLAQKGLHMQPLFWNFLPFECLALKPQCSLNSRPLEITFLYFILKEKSK